MRSAAASDRQVQDAETRRADREAAPGGQRDAETWRRRPRGGPAPESPELALEEPRDPVAPRRRRFRNRSLSLSGGSRIQSKAKSTLELALEQELAVRILRKELCTLLDLCV